MWAAIVALADQKAGISVGFLNPTTYNLTTKANDFHDITVGNNTLVGSTIGFNAAAGWDDVSGWGTPNLGYLINDL